MPTVSQACKLISEKSDKKKHLALQTYKEDLKILSLTIKS